MNRRGFSFEYVCVCVRARGCERVCRLREEGKSADGGNTSNHSRGIQQIH